MKTREQQQQQLTLFEGQNRLTDPEREARVCSKRSSCSFKPLIWEDSEVHNSFSSFRFGPPVLVHFSAENKQLLCLVFSSLVLSVRTESGKRALAMLPPPPMWNTIQPELKLSELIPRGAFRSILRVR